jgi:poly(hydroxyalkanoate) depolymerase family esterase
MNRHRNQILVVASLFMGLLLAAPAHAASLQKLDQSVWGGGTANGFPSYVNMYIYVPAQVAAKPPIVTGPHSCQGNGSGTFSQMSSLVSVADKTGFIMIFPEATGRNCWDAGSAESLKNGGKGDTGAIVQMVKYTLTKYSGDANRVYTVGMSSGGIMTEALLGVYPDIFMGGVSIMGVPCGCWADGYDKGGTAQWSNNCAGGTLSKTGAEWGALVRSYFPGYNGHRPRLQHWHGTSDTTINYKNLAQDVLEWTNLLGLSEAPTGTDTPKSGTTHNFWKNSCFTVYETFSLSGVAHAVGLDGPGTAKYFGLDTAGGQDPETAACPGAVPGGSGAGGAGGTSGTGGAGGARDGGVAGKDGGISTGGSSSGGVQATGGGGAGGGGKSSTGGAMDTGGSTVNGGAKGGSSGNSSVASSGGSSSSSSAKGGSSNGGGVVAVGGIVASSGSSVNDSSGGAGAGGSQASGGSQGSNSTANSKPKGGTSGGCALGGRAGDSTASAATLLLVVLGLVLHRRKRRTR